MTQALDMERYGRLARPRIDDGAPPLGGRVGLNVPSQWWPTAPTLKMIEAAGFGWFQLHGPPRAMLCDSERSARHAAALRTVRDLSGLRLGPHAPDALSAG